MRLPGAKWVQMKTARDFSRAASVFNA